MATPRVPPEQTPLHAHPLHGSVPGQLSILPALDEGLGHELRNLVMPMLLRLDALSKSESLSGKAQSDLEGIRQSVLHLQRIANGLRLLSVDPATQELEDQQTRLHRWWKEIKTLVVDALPAHAFVRADLPPDQPAVLIPPGVLSHILLHSLAEARSALQHVAMPRLSISATQSDAGIDIVVTDNGPPLTQAQQELEAKGCFENRTNDAGAGLRLCVARSLTQRYGGTLRRTIDSKGASSLIIALQTAPDAEDVMATGQQRVQVLVTEPRQQAFARLLVAQRGMREVTVEEETEFIVCDARQYCEMATVDELPELFDAGVTFLVIGRPNGEPHHRQVHWIAARELARLKEYLR